MEMEIGKASKAIGAALILSCAGISRGAVTFYWSGDSQVPNPGSSPNISVDPLAVHNSGSSLIDNTSPSSTDDYAGASGGNNFQATAPLGALDKASSAYFSMTLTPANGYAITLNSISLGSRSTGTGPTTLAFYSSIDDYGSAIGSANVNNDSNWALITQSSFTGSHTGSMNSPVEFRIYGSDGTGSKAGSGDWRIDDISFTVTATQVPEPAAWGYGSGIALIGFCSVRFWRERRAGKNVGI